jgi:hypothetical protein
MASTQRKVLNPVAIGSFVFLNAVLEGPSYFAIGEHTDLWVGYLSAEGGRRKKVRFFING